MPPWVWLGYGALAVLAIAMLCIFWLVTRRRWISRNGGTFEFSVRVRPDKAGRGWVLGLGRYSGDVLEWFRIFSASPRASLRFRRADLVFVGRRDPVGDEVYALYAGNVIVSCLVSEIPIDVAMSPEALTGFLAWLEAAPPGRGRPPVL